PAPRRPGLPRVDRSRVFRRLRRDARRLDPLLERLATTVDLVCPPGWDAAATDPGDGSEREAAKALAPRRLGGLRRRGAREAAPDGLRHPTGADRRLGAANADRLARMDIDAQWAPGDKQISFTRMPP